MFAVVGPTGAGKSAFALALAAELTSQSLKAEIINADAMQLYRGMDIGTAKVTATERAQVIHHMLDVLEPQQEASVNKYQREVTSLLEDMQSRDVTPILVGGSGLYVNSVLYEMNFAPHNAEVRQELETLYATVGLEPLVQELIVRDVAAAESIDIKNPRRVIRALEILRISKQPLIAHLPKKPALLRPTLVLGINDEREKLTARLDKRVENMWEAGLLTEVAKLCENGLRLGKTASQAIGYAQALKELDGEYNTAQAIAETQLLTRRYARRQVSWFKRLPQLKWINSNECMNTATVTRIIKEYTALTQSRHKHHTQQLCSVTQSGADL